jgi:hypothetical protein
MMLMSRRLLRLSVAIVLVGLAVASPGRAAETPGGAAMAPGGAAMAPTMKPPVATQVSPTRLPLIDPGARGGGRPPAKATIALGCERVIVLSTGSGRGTCSADPAAGTAKCDDGDGNMASAACPGCKRTSGSGSCLIQ